jgi:molybdenum cofactor cytidylyltransferase
VQVLAVSPTGALTFHSFFCYLPGMSRALRLCGVILAAGESERMGTDKALLPWPPAAPGHAKAGTFLSAAVASLELSTDLVIVVAGKNQSHLAPIVYASGAFMVVNPEPARGQFSSMQVGLQAVLSRGRDAAMVTLVDRPPVSAATVERLHTAFDTAIRRWKWGVVPEYAGRHGHPIALAREMIEAFLKAPATATAREIEHQNREHLEYVEVDDPLVTANINTPAEYEALRSSTTFSL